MSGRGPGPLPKDPAQRRRRNKETRTQLPAAAAAELRALPPGRWSAAAKRWWATWAASEQSALFLATDWQRLEMLLPLVQRYLQEPDKALMAEIRLNEERLGATAGDRMRLKWDTEKPQAPAEEPGAGSRARLRVVDKGAG